MRTLHTRHTAGFWSVISLALGVLSPGHVAAQTFSSGSTGALGDLTPFVNTTVTLPADGVLNFTTVTIPEGVVVKFQPNAANTPVTLLATGDVTIAGTIELRGLNPGEGGLPLTFAAAGGPGGFPGGIRGNPGIGGSGPGGGEAAGPTQPDRNASYGAPSVFVSLIPLFGGSGGGGDPGDPNVAGGGGGGGGAIVIASSTKITVTGSINANGGAAGFQSLAGNGSGGAIRLVAPQVTGTGFLSADGGQQISTVKAGAGRIRIEAFTPGFVGTSIPSASLSTAPGPVTPASTPALVNAPRLTFASIGGIASPTTPTGSYAAADVSLPAGTTNPVGLVLTANNIPVGTVFTVKVIPQLNAISTVSTSASSGTFDTATATANVTFPTGEVSLLLAQGSFTLPQLASLVPEIDREPIERVMVVAEYGGASTLALITTSGKEVRVDQLPLTEQLKLGITFAALREVR